MPRRAVGISPSLSACARALTVTTPPARNLRTIEARFSARASAAFLCANRVLILPFVDRPRCVSIRTTVVRCQWPPWAVAIPLRFSSLVSARWETKPAASSFRMVEAKALSREFAAHLLASPPRIPRRQDEAVPSCFIRTSWPDDGVLGSQWFSVKIVSEV